MNARMVKVVAETKDQATGRNVPCERIAAEIEIEPGKFLYASMTLDKRGATERLMNRIGSCVRIRKYGVLMAGVWEFQPTSVASSGTLCELSREEAESVIRAVGTYRKKWSKKIGARAPSSFIGKSL